MKAINWKDRYTDTKYRKILTTEYLDTPGLQIFGRQIRISATESLPLHFHENCYELVYIASGTASFFVDGKYYSLGGGDAFVTRPNQLHGTNAVPVTISEMYWLQFSFDSTPNFFHLDSAASHTMEDSFSRLSSPKISTSGNEIEKFLHEAFQIALTGCNLHLISQYLTLAFSMILSYSEQTIFKLSPDIGWAMNYILDHITERLTLEEIAKGAFLSVSQFKQKFKQQLGISPRQFINSQKIEYAMALLEEDCSVEETARKLILKVQAILPLYSKNFAAVLQRNIKSEFTSKIQSESH
ncbi:AraC family transcriptional regulator [Clostridiaceae bacterium]|nr:AraC family transcriptional regulator [Clostridiaceae bacterium]